MARIAGRVMSALRPNMHTKDFQILYVDDDENDIQLARLAVPSAGLEGRFHTVKSGAQAIDYLQGRSPYSDRSKFPMPKLILLDLRMPRMNGLELLAWIKSQPELSGLVVIVFTASAHPDDTRRACELGSNAFVQKPSSHVELIQLLKLVKEFWGGFHEFPELKPHSRHQDIARPSLIP